ncbi:MAG: SPOR domain-containing protein, partial [Candidatus Mariimomonas ferrooxydans]
MILQGANSILTISKFSFFLIFLLFLPLYSYGAETIYTIQTGTFIRAERAQKQFDSLRQKLDEGKLDFLRIEKVNKYHTVRLGKFESKSAAEKFLRVITPQFPGALLLKAYVIDKRIVRWHSRKSLPEKEAISDNDSEAVLVKVKELVKEGNYKDALTLLSPYTSEPKKYPTAVSDYLVILVWNKKYDDAINMYENLPAQFPRPLHTTSTITH